VAVAKVTRARVGRIEMEYVDSGSGGSARPFLLVHGFTGSRDDFREQLPLLAERGRTIAPDLRGHGGSSSPGDPSGYSLEQLVHDLVGFLDALAIERCDLLGHSMGGMVAMRLALARPERVASLVLMDTAPGPIRQEARRFFEVSAEIARTSGMEGLFAVARQVGRDDPTRPPSVRRLIERMGADVYWERIRAKLVSMDVEAFGRLGRALTEHESVEPRLGEIRCPTTVLVGAEDAPFLKPSERMAAAIPCARHVVIADASHSPQLENPEAWRSEVVAHLARARGGGA
jgi:pimeloyl-ACP methyl ester carboxylesterase